MLKKIKQLKKRHVLVRYFTNTSWLFAEKILRMTVGVFVGVWVARYIGVEQFGLLSYTQSFVALFAAVATLGLDSIVVRELVKSGAKGGVLLGTAFMLKFIGALIVLSMLAIATFMTSNDQYTNTLIFIIASSVIFQSFNVIDFYFQSRVLSKYIVYANIVSTFISSLLKILFIIKGMELIFFVYLILFDSIVIALGYMVFYVKFNFSLPVNKWNFDKKIALSLLKDSWPLILAGLAINVNQNIDQVMLKDMMGNESVGVYAAVVKLVNAVVIIPFLIAKSIYPNYIQSYEHDKEVFNRKIIQGYRVLLLLCLAPTLVLIFYSSDVIQITYGENYQQSSIILQTYALVILFSAIGAINMIYLRVVNLQKKAMNRQLVNVVINISLNYYLIPIYGVLGAVYATLTSIVFTTVIYDLLDRDMHMLNKLKVKSVLSWNNG